MRLGLVLVPLLVGCGAEILPAQLAIDEELRPHVEQFYADCSVSPARLRCEYALRYLSEVRFAELPTTKLGVATTQTWWEGGALQQVSRVRVNPSARVHPVLLRHVVYHELGHVIGYGHLPNSAIMAPEVEPQNVYVDAQAWKRNVRLLFQGG